MKGFKRSAQPDQQPAEAVDTVAEARQQALRPGMVVVAVGLLLAAVLVWLGLPPPSDREYRSQLAQALATGQAASLQQAVAQLRADTQASAANPLLIQALQSQDGKLVKAAEQAVRSWSNAVDVQVNLRGMAEPDPNRPAPINFRALDIIRRAESDRPVPLEAQKVGQRWLVYSVAPIRANGADSPILGTLLTVVDLQRLLNALYPIDLGAGEFVLQQAFADGPPQTLYQRGTAQAEKALSLASGNPNWQLAFRAGPAFEPQVPWRTAVLMLLAVLVVISACAIAFSIVLGRLHRQVASDARQLEQLLQELSGGKAVKAFGLSLPELNELARSLARFSLRGRQPTAVEPVAGHALPVMDNEVSASAPHGQPPAGWADPLFQDTDILDEDLDSLRLEHPHDMSTAIVAPKFPDSIFRAYDIRGVVGDTLSAETAYWIGRAIGSQSLAQGEPHVSVGRDGRLSGPELVQQLIQGVADAGCHVSDVGLVPTPALYYAANVLAGKSGVMLTGSHNPKDYNGFKIVIAGDTLANEQIQALHNRLKTGDLTQAAGTIERVDILPRYWKQIAEDIVISRKLKVVVDCGNGAAGVIAPQLIEALGCEVIPLFCDVDGNFPNHHPDPGKLENLEDLIAKVKETGADVGLAFDGDGDRVGVVTNTGSVIYPDRLLMLFARDVLSRKPGADIIFDVKCTRRLTPLINQWGGRPVMFKTGHSLIKKEMKRTGAELAGEMSGHIFFKERWFGFDDGIYSAVRLLEILSQEKSSAEELFLEFPEDISTPEINIKVTEESKFSIIKALEKDAQWGEANLTTIDGVRVDYPKGWGLVRASNTTPVLVLRFEADDEAELERIKEVFRVQLRAVQADLNIPF